MHPIMNQELAKQVQHDFRKVSAHHRLVSTESTNTLSIEPVIMSTSLRKSLSSRLRRLRFIQLQSPIRFSEG